MGLINKSLESDLKVGFFLLLIVEMLLALWALADLSWVLRLSACIGLILLNGILFMRIYRRTSEAFERLNLQLEAINSKDYSLHAKSPYPQGKVRQLHQQLNTLAERLQSEKSQFDLQMFLVYRLIDQLNTPILVFDHRLQLSHANAAFSDLYDRPWQTMQFSLPERLELSNEPTWRFLDKRKQEEWQIRHSDFVDQGKRYQLLVFINIQSALRETQLNAWKNLIRVMSHEIKNSLTPVAALTQNLRSKETNTRNQQALDVIVERCEHLQVFVSRYAQLQKNVNVQKQKIESKSLVAKLRMLYPDVAFDITERATIIWADPILLEQTVINLIKNAVEACSHSGKGLIPIDDSAKSEVPKIAIGIQFDVGNDKTHIRITDEGQGIADSANLFVPFYSTKTNGLGIGLTLSRHLVEQMGGRLTLENNPTGRGASATISLPLQKVKNIRPAAH